MDAYFNRIKRLSADQTFSSRLRFKFQDVLELRSNEWVPRREENAPKKIAEVHADAMAKQFADELEAVMGVTLTPTGGSTGTTPTPGKKGTVKGARDTSPQPSRTTDEWQTQGVKKPKGKKGKSASTKQPQLLDISEPESITTPNRFATGTLSAEDVEQAINNILQEYFVNTDTKEAVRALLQLLKGTDFLSKIVEVGISNSLEKKDKERDLVSKLFGQLCAKGKLTEQQFAKGLKTIVDSINELEIDIPQASKLVAHFIASAVADKCISMGTLENTVGLPDKLKPLVTESLELKK